MSQQVNWSTDNILEEQAASTFEVQHSTLLVSVCSDDGKSILLQNTGYYLPAGTTYHL